MAQKVKIDFKKTIYNVYTKHGLSAAYQWVKKYNDLGENVIPFEACKECDANTPSIDHECCYCGQETNKAEMQIEVKITGNGTRQEIIESLDKILKNLKKDNGEMEKYLACGMKSTSEDPTLFAEFKEITE